MNTNYDRILQTTLANYADSLKEVILENFRHSEEMFDRFYPEGKRLREIGPIHGPERPPMLVSELIAELQKLPQEAEVWTTDSEWGDDPYPWNACRVAEGRRVYV